MNQPQEIHLPGAPTPVQTATAGPVNTPEGQRIALLVKSMNGEFAFYLDAKHAKTLAAQLETLATQVQTGLILPPSPNGLSGTE